MQALLRGRSASNRDFIIGTPKQAGDPRNKVGIYVPGWLYSFFRMAMRDECIGRHCSYLSVQPSGT